jgi:hypothetical protein
VKGGEVHRRGQGIGAAAMLVRRFCKHELVRFRRSFANISTVRIS